MRKPEWLKIKINSDHIGVSRLLRENNLVTV